jgi:hypothetical protein
VSEVGYEDREEITMELIAVRPFTEVERSSDYVNAYERDIERLKRFQ